jgi:AhpD family alkylhydroperoxidase
MTQRINPYANLELVRPLIDYGRAVEASLEPTLAKLIEIRASQVNGCAICLDMHTREAIEAGETPERIWNLEAWRESPLYSAREKAALGWTEALTRLADTHAPDADYAALAAEFSDAEQVRLTMMIGVINSFNKLGVGFRVRPIGAARRAAA